MIYWDGRKIDSVVIGEKTVCFGLAGSVKRTVRAGSLIALAHDHKSRSCCDGRAYGHQECLVRDYMADA